MTDFCLRTVRTLESARNDAPPSNRCPGHKERMAEHEARVAAKLGLAADGEGSGTQSRGDEKTCHRCGATYISRRTLYCSDACRRSVDVAERKRRRAGERKCHECGDWFVVSPKRYRYCSVNCVKAGRRRRKQERKHRGKAG